jgi:hypothetical protein
MQTIAGAVGLVVAITYVIGGLIVNLHLSRYGITEYQILRVKYLVVGLTYLTNFIAVLFLAAIPATLLIESSSLLQYVFLVASLLASVWLLWLWGRPLRTSKQRTLRSWGSWWFWLVLSTVSSIFPIMIGIRLLLNALITFESGVLIILAFLASVLSFIGQIYYYARYLYGHPNPTFGSFGSVDPIGMGIPVKIRLAGEAKDISLLKSMGVPSVQPELTDDLVLLDETDTHYIVGIPIDGDIRAAKVKKDIVKSILYLG